MNNSKVLFQDFIAELTLNESRDELQSIGYLVFEKVLGLSRMDILTNKSLTISESQKQTLKETALRLNTHEPVQYVLGEALFFGRMFSVCASVLIPRPETEELISLVLKSTQQITSPNILDIGTGSGCIPITLSLELKGSTVTGTDISTKAIEVASANATQLKAGVRFIEHDILNQDLPFTDLDVITSNPPYIALEEKDKMNNNVVMHEPHLALFVDNNDPLIFYRVITVKASKALKPNGLLVVEINERFGEEVANLFAANNFIDVEVIKDLSGKDRIVKGILKK